VDCKELCSVHFFLSKILIYSSGKKKTKQTNINNNNLSLRGMTQREVFACGYLILISSYWKEQMYPLLVTTAVLGSETVLMFSSWKARHR